MILFAGFGVALDAFGDLDTDGDGRLDGGDEVVRISGGDTYIDLSHLYGAPERTHLIRVDETGLTADDFMFMA